MAAPPPPPGALPFPLPPGYPPPPVPLPPGAFPAAGQNPMGYPPKDPDFIETQSTGGYMHELYRTTGSSVIDQTDPTHAAALQGWTQPVVGAGAFQLPRPRSQAARDQLAAAIENRGRVLDPTNPGGFNAGNRPRPAADDQAAIQGHINRASRLMTALRMAFVKQLDWDRNGSTTLWHWRNRTGGAGNVVAYAPLADYEDLYFNLSAKFTHLSRSPHIVHRAPLRRHLAPGASETQMTAADELENDAGFIWTEWTKYGDLGRWIARVANRAEQFPRSVLWRLFECLIDACIAMAYPPRLQRNPNHRLFGEEIGELIPLNPVPNGYRNLVHMALSPSEVYIEDYHDNTHDDVPRLQVGGFDISHFSYELGGANFMPPPNNFSRLTRLWTRARMHGREGWWLPEHFTVEWDRVNYEPYNEGFTDMTTGMGAAGAFSERSNIFHIGMNIWCCMLLQQPERPPRATPIPRTGANMGAQGWTYTGEMRFQDYHIQFGRDLCDLVSDCCKYMPRDRPGLRTVKTRVENGKSANPMTNADRDWVRRTIREPNAPPILNPQPGVQAAGAPVALRWGRARRRP